MKKILLLTLSLSAAPFILAQEKQYDSADEFAIVNDTVKKYSLNEVVVNGNPQDVPATVGKANINPMDLPQATTIITNETLKNQQVSSLSDILKNANGVYIMGTVGGYQEEIASRGFSMRSDNTFKNGVRYFNGMMIETSGLEKVEFLKGSAAMLYGNVAPGGILNLVTKKPKFNFGGEVGFAFGSFNTYKPTFDVYNAIGKNKKVAFRVNGSYEKAESFRDYVESERYYLNPSFLFKLSDKTELLVETDYTNDSRTPDFGSGVIDYELVDIPRSRFLGVTWGYFDSEQLSNTITLTHHLNDNWSVNFINGIRYYETELFSNARPNTGGSISEDGEWTRNLQRSKEKNNYFTQQANLNGKFTIGKTQHQFLFGADVENYKTNATRYNNYTGYDTINIFNNYDPSSEGAIPDLTLNTYTQTPISRFGIYVQDLISFAEKWKLLAGVRYSYQDTESNVYKYSNSSTTITNNYDGAFSPRVGLIYQPSKKHSLFATYSNSFQTNTGTDIDGNALDPSIIDQYEVGIKNKLFNDKIQANVTFYQINNDNLAQTSLANGNTNSSIKELAGAIRSNGVEIDITANPVKGLQIVAGYSFNETKYRKSNTYIEGSLLRYNPKNTANLSINYKVESGKLKGLNVGLINSYFGTRYAGRSTRITEENDNRKLIYLSDYFQVDATLGYDYKNFSIRTKLANIFNELNYNAHDDNSLNPIAPRNYSVALSYKF
ncbi:TonB-dependent siderophore receptor [Flavobacterium sp. NRK F10]|uniref:TonB-dependent siderophore receptor n=1 Tax=Flavobacterium sp. NRK F10 TaxID=2954931 RepID=UPI00209071B9|nr:TonB-dependent siderophore receptor [Flavobacterium sp. NRK F10]MCO6173862.1 TonB-dependent siderophore receptor [Flavobacterium sp. NRK F10]